MSLRCMNSSNVFSIVAVSVSRRGFERGAGGLGGYLRRQQGSSVFGLG
jgi:hypothetical protein